MHATLHLPLITRTTWENKFEPSALAAYSKHFHPVLSPSSVTVCPPVSLITDKTWKALLTRGAQI